MEKAIRICDQCFKAGKEVQSSHACIFCGGDFCNSHVGILYIDVNAQALGLNKGTCQAMIPMCVGCVDILISAEGGSLLGKLTGTLSRLATVGVNKLLVPQFSDEVLQRLQQTRSKDGKIGIDVESPLNRLLVHIEERYWTCPRDEAVVQEINMSDDHRYVYVIVSEKDEVSLEWVKRVASGFMDVVIEEEHSEDKVGKFVKFMIRPRIPVQKTDNG